MHKFRHNDTYSELLNTEYHRPVVQHSSKSTLPLLNMPLMLRNCSANKTD